MFFLSIFIWISFHAKAADFFVWKQFPDSVPVVMAKKDGQSETDAIKEYFSTIHQNNSFKGLLDQEEIQDLKVGETLPFQRGTVEPFKGASERPKILVVTNELRELYRPPYSKRVQNFKKRLESFGADVYILPVVHDAILPIHEAKAYRQKIIEAFDAQLVMGGRDIDPYLYGEKTTYAKSIVRRRDVSELKFVRQYIEAKKGMNFGICRGHQMCAVANHKKLIQDIQIEEGASEVHLNGEHFIKYDPNSEIFSVFDEEKLYVNSLHHQAVIVPEDDKTYKVIASSFDKKPIVEGVEFRNGLGFTLQFHPELMHDETGDKIMKRFVTLTIKQRKLLKDPTPCKNLMESFL